MGEPEPDLQAGDPGCLSQVAEAEREQRRNPFYESMRKEPECQYYLEIL